MAKKRGNSEGSIYKMSDGRWRAAVTTGYRNGKLVRKVYTAGTRGDVQDKLTHALRDQQLGLPIVGERETVGRFLNHWLDHVAANKVRPSTLESYRWITEKHLIPCLGRSCLSGCFSKPQDVAVSHNTCCQPSRRACGFRSTRGLSPPARHRLKPALFWAKLITGPLARAKLRSCICCLAANTICWGLLKQPDKQKAAI